MIRLRTLSMALLAALAVRTEARCDMLVNYDFASGSSASGTAPGVTATGFLAGDGLLNVDYGGTANARGWNPSTSAADAISHGDYWSFTVTAAPGYTLNLGQLTFDDSRGNKGPTAFQIDVNGTLVGSTGTATTSSLLQTYDLSSFTGLTNATLRFMAWNAANNGNSAQWFLDNVRLDGSLVIIPANPQITHTPLPPTMVMLAMGVLPLQGFVRRWRHRQAPVAAA